MSTETPMDTKRRMTIQNFFKKKCWILWTNHFYSFSIIFSRFITNFVILL